MNYWTLCDSSAPGLSGDVYRLPYAEAVTGYRHGYATKRNGIEWTRYADHPEDPRCPECNAPTEPARRRPELHPRKRTGAHVPDENLARYRRLMKLSRHVDQVGNTRSNRGDYAGANRAWARADRIKTAAQTLRAPGRREVRPLSDGPDPVTPADNRPPVHAHEHPPDVPA